MNRLQKQIFFRKILPKLILLVIIFGSLLYFIGLKIYVNHDKQKTEQTLKEYYYNNR
jgi:hypothetical protein